MILWIVVDYLTDLFNRNSRDYREVSMKLAEMKSKDKILQKERLRVETSGGPVNQYLLNIFNFITIPLILGFSSGYRSNGWW